MFAILLLPLAVFAQSDDESQSFFVDDSGVPTLTNQPEYYRADDNFTEVEIKYEPIVIPDRYDFTNTGRIETDRE